jgi:hypothetical protein
MSAPLQLTRGRITRLNRAGIGFVTTDDSRASGREFVFSYDRIRRQTDMTYVPYRGEALKDIGFKEGAQVAFSEDANGVIESIEVDQ